MAIPNDYIDKITNKDSGESRIISPAADKVRVDNENFEGTDLDEVLDEVAHAIEEAGSGDGTVTCVKVGSTTYEPTDGVVDLSTPFGGKVDKNGTDSLMTAAEHTKLQNLPTNEQLIQQFGSKANDADVVKSISVNGGTAQTPTNGNVNIVVPSGGLTESDISVETQGDGTVDINVGNDTYTINLNHTHEGMAKIVKCTEATLPQTLENDTIYVQVDNATTPTDIESLWLFGLEFTGGGLPAGTPAITKPSGTTINLGENEGSGVSNTIEIKANSHITGDLTVGLAANSDLSFDTTNLPSGVTYNSGAGTLTITQAAAMQGVNITVVYSGSGAAEIDDGLVISGGGASPKSVVVVVDALVQLAGVKLTGTQWLQTNYYPNPNTELELSCLFIENSLSKNTSESSNNTFIDCVPVGSERFTIYHGSHNASNVYGSFVIIINNDTIKYNNEYQLLTFDSSATSKAAFLTDMQIKYLKGSGKMDTTATTATYSAQARRLPLKATTMSNALMIGRSNSGAIYNCFDLVIYELKIKENGTVVQDWMPKNKNGVAGLYDTVTGTFISSETSTELVAVPLT